MTFRVGQKVVCVDPVNDLVLNKIYTVVSVHDRHMDVEESSWRFPFGSFYLRRFRPVVEDLKRLAFTIGADPESERWDNRKKQNERV